MTIVCRNEQLQLDPQCPEIAAALGTISRTAVPDDEHGYRLAARLESLLEPRVPRPNAGLLPVVCRLLGQAGYEPGRPRRSSEPPADLPTPAEGAVQWQGPCDTQMLALTRTTDHGLIRYDGRGGIDIARLIAEIAVAFPQATIAVMVASRDAGHRLRQRLGRWLRGVTFLDARPSGQPVARIVVGTPCGMSNYDVELNKRDFVLLPRAWEALHEHAQDARMTADPRFRLYGFSPSNCKLSPQEQDWITATFGFQEVFIPRHGFVERPVRVVWSPVDGGPRLPLGASMLELKRLGLWSHPVRNRRIARIALEFSRRDTAWLRQRVPEIAMAGSASTACRVLVVVEGVAHALALANLLPGWPMIVGANVCEAELDRSRRQLLAQRRALPNTNGPMIATLAGLARPSTLDLSTVDVAVWAGGGSHLPPLPADCLTCRAEQARGLLLVDFNDRHHPQLRRWSRRRRETCSDAEWIGPGSDPVLARIDRFLARRPGRRAR